MKILLRNYFPFDWVNAEWISPNNKIRFNDLPCLLRYPENFDSFFIVIYANAEITRNEISLDSEQIWASNEKRERNVCFRLWIRGDIHKTKFKFSTTDPPRVLRGSPGICLSKYLHVEHGLHGALCTVADKKYLLLKKDYSVHVHWAKARTIFVLTQSKRAWFRRTLSQLKLRISRQNRVFTKNLPFLMQNTEEK